MGKDVTETESARDEVERLTGRLTIPVALVKVEILSGLDINRLANILGISADIKTIEKSVVKNIAPRFTEDQLNKIYQNAKNVLDKNRYNGWTMPSSQLYPHIWSWDSGFISRGYLHYDPDSGRGLGEKDFSWTAALIIDLIAQRLRKIKE